MDAIFGRVLPVTDISMYYIIFTKSGYGVKYNNATSLEDYEYEYEINDDYTDANLRIVNG